MAVDSATQTHSTTAIVYILPVLTFYPPTVKFGRPFTGSEFKFNDLGGDHFDPTDSLISGTSVNEPSQ